MTYSGLHFDELRKQQQLESWQESEEQNVPLGHGLANAVEGSIQRGVSWLQEQAKDDPDTWTDDALRLMGGGLKNISNIVERCNFKFAKFKTNSTALNG